MEERLTIITCKNYYLETFKAIEEEALTDVHVALMPSDCVRCLRYNTDKLNSYIQEHFSSCENVKVMGCNYTCDAKLHAESEQGKFSICQTLLCGAELIDQYTSKGCYVLSPGWLKNWKKYILEDWGFNEDTGKAFLQESAKKLLLLDSGIYENSYTDLQELSYFCSLEYEVLNVGMDFFKSRMLNTYYKWKTPMMELSVMKAERKTSDYALVYELLPQIVTQKELNQLIEDAFQIFVMFTAASNLAFTWANEGNKGEMVFYRNCKYDTQLYNIHNLSFEGDHYITPSGIGFILKIAMDDILIGFLEVEGILFADHIQSYTQLSLFIAKVLALSIANALNYKQLADAKVSAEKASRTKSDFLANMSHEIRTPMNGILGFLQLLERTILDVDQKDFVFNIKTSTEMLLNLINDILDISKIEAGRLELEEIPFDIRSSIEAAVMSFAARAAEKGLELNLLIRSDVPQKAKGDPTRLRQVISNLVSNAVKFTDKGDILVETNVKEKTEDHLELLVTVKDTGIGMSRETTDKLFSPFTQADASSTRKYGGTGLGLSICKRLVKMMNGAISVKSQVGKGSIFQFSILLKTSDEREIPEFRNYSALRGRRIMIVDDHAMNCEIARIYLEEAGIIADEAKSGTDAIDRIIRCDGSKCIYDAVLIDCHMPGMNGHDLSAALKAIPATKDIPLFLVTSVAGNDEAKKAKKNGFAGYLSKPYKRKELLDCISMVLTQKDTNSDNVESFITRHVVREAKFRKKPRILLAEDNQMNRNLFIKLLHSNGFSCDIAENGEEALKASINNQYDIIFMDCQMPVMSGYEVTKKIREAEGESRNTVIIAVTAYALKEDEDKCREAGMDGYISKPVSIEAVISAISKVSIMSNNDSRTETGM